MKTKIFGMILGIIFLIGSIGTAAAEAPNASEWAQKDILFLEECGVVPRSLVHSDYMAAISRANFAELLYNAYLAQIGKTYQPLDLQPFPDTTSVAAAALYELGVLSGDENGNFSGMRGITRQEAAKMLCVFYGLIEGQGVLTAREEVLNQYADQRQISAWARTPVAILTDLKIMGDRGDGNFYPFEPLTAQEAVVLIGRMVEIEPQPADISAQSGKVPAVPAELSDISGDGTVTVGADFTVTAEWKDFAPGSTYSVTVVEWRNALHQEEIGARDPVPYQVNEPRLSFQGDPLRQYDITVAAAGKQILLSALTGEAVDYATRLAEVDAYGRPETQEAAEAMMVEITVPVWNIRDGQKVPSTLSMRVHPAIAGKMQAVFEEIYNGEEKFPIYSAGAYAWRGGTSEHNWGTAVDINPDENYCLYTNGTIVGNYWKPYQDPYSVTPYGEVIRAFEKYGFTWGGDAWRGNRDFMHFSYLGT